MPPHLHFSVPLLVLAVAAAACTEGSMSAADLERGLDPDDAPRVAIDRFSDRAGTLLRRATNPALPGPDEPIDFSEFLERGLGPDGELISYFNLDVQLGRTMDVHRIVDAQGLAIAGQLPIVPAIVGEEGYFDFWHIVEHQAPDDYVANTISNVDDLLAREWPQSGTAEGFNRPLVPEGSTADARVASPMEQRGEPGIAWYEDSVVSYLGFEEAPIEVRTGFVPYAQIYVCFDTPPAADGSPTSDFCRQDDGRTHNVIDTNPTDPGYSPLWRVTAYDASAFDDVQDLESASAAPNLTDLTMVNCPIAIE